MSRTFTIEFDYGPNDNFFFHPIQRSLRGRWDFTRCNEQTWGSRRAEWDGAVIPGQRVGLDLDKAEGWIEEPLHNPEYAALKERIARKGMALGEAREVFPKVDTATWHYWCLRAVQDGFARVVSGNLPDRVEGEAQKSFFVQHRPGRKDRLMEKMLAVLIANLPESKRKEVASLFDE